MNATVTQVFETITAELVTYHVKHDEMKKKIEEMDAQNKKLIQERDDFCKQIESMKIEIEITNKHRNEELHSSISLIKSEFEKVFKGYSTSKKEYETRKTTILEVLESKNAEFANNLEAIKANAKKLAGAFN